MNRRCPKCNLEYTGEVNPTPGQQVFNQQGQMVSPYIPNDELKESIRLAIALKRPLLLMGDPGCGKTKLALALAYEFTRNNPEALKWAKLKEWPFFSWYVKSTSKARNGLYTYDAVGRLRDAQLANSDYLEKETIINRLQDPNHRSYIKYGALGNAFKCPLPAVVLIDEIDKADIDFPNDLLLELDERRFFIDEIQAWMPQERAPAPIVLITSNNERPLPDAFLRRCFFHYFEPPETDELEKILKAHFGDRLPKALTSEIIASFINLRKLGQERTGGKQVGTSELLDWANALLLEEPKSILKKLKQGLPFSGVLLKTREEQIRYQGQRRDSE